MIERLKTQEYKEIIKQNYFWRSFSQKEVDWVEVRNQRLRALEFKFKKSSKNKMPKEFIKFYNPVSFEFIDRDNWLELVEMD